MFTAFYIKLWLLKTGEYLVTCSLDFAFARTFRICGRGSRVFFHVIRVVELKLDFGKENLDIFQFFREITFFWVGPPYYVR